MKLEREENRPSISKQNRDSSSPSPNPKGLPPRVPEASLDRGNSHPQLDLFMNRSPTLVKREPKTTSRASLPLPPSSVHTRSSSRNGDDSGVEDSSLDPMTLQRRKKLNIESSLNNISELGSSYTSTFNPNFRASPTPDLESFEDQTEIVPCDPSSSDSVFRYPSPTLTNDRPVSVPPSNPTRVTDVYNEVSSRKRKRSQSTSPTPVTEGSSKPTTGDSDSGLPNVGGTSESQAPPTRDPTPPSIKKSTSSRKGRYPSEIWKSFDGAYITSLLSNRTPVSSMFHRFSFLQICGLQVLCNCHEWDRD
jgi:hypothetical protein